MHTVFALLCFVVVIHWPIFPYPSGLLHWHCGNLTIAPVPAKQPWWIWINTLCEFIMNDCITTTKQSTTKPCAYFLGYTVGVDKTKLIANVNMQTSVQQHFANESQIYNVWDYKHIHVRFWGTSRDIVLLISGIVFVTKSAIGSLKTYPKFDLDFICTWFMTCLFIIVPLISMFLPMYIFKNSSYVE